jgi:hypothetical protein
LGPAADLADWSLQEMLLEPVSPDTSTSRAIFVKFCKGSAIPDLLAPFLPMTESTPSTRFGFVAFAETWNGRLAMLGFVIGLGTELLTGQGILGQLGLG